MGEKPHLPLQDLLKRMTRGVVLVPGQSKTITQEGVTISVMWGRGDVYVPPDPYSFTNGYTANRINSLHLETRATSESPYAPNFRDVAFCYHLGAGGGPPVSHLEDLDGYFHSVTLSSPGGSNYTLDVTTVPVEYGPHGTRTVKPQTATPTR